MNSFGAIAILVLGVVALSSSANINFTDGETGLIRAFKWIKSDWDGLVDDVKNGSIPREVAITVQTTTKKPIETFIEKRSVELTEKTTKKPIKTRVIQPAVEWTEKTTEKEIVNPVVELSEMFAVENGTVITKLTVKPTEKTTGKPITTTTGKPITTTTGKPITTTTSKKIMTV